MTEDINPWKTLSAEEKYDNPWINVTEYQVINPSGGRGIYGKIHYKNHALGIIPMDDDLNIWLVGQYRYVLNQYSWEIPEGGGPFDVDPLDSAKRELLEETGFTATNWDLIQTMHLSNSVGDEFARIYLARGLKAGHAEPEETEDLKLKKVSFNEAYDMVLDGRITDSMAVAGILKLKIMQLENRLT